MNILTTGTPVLGGSHESQMDNTVDAILHDDTLSDKQVRGI